VGKSLNRNEEDWRRERDSNPAQALGPSITYGSLDNFCPLQSPGIPRFGSRFGSRDGAPCSRRTGHYRPLIVEYLVTYQDKVDRAVQLLEELVGLEARRKRGASLFLKPIPRICHRRGRVGKSMAGSLSRNETRPQLPRRYWAQAMHCRSTSYATRCFRW
jgi:hypothetical protein